jgi:VIT1/CCC1 family predicted Fe2+/Mn2+ transporter
MKPINIRRRHKPGNGFLDSLIDPIDWLSETIFSILIFLLYILAFGIIMLSRAPQGPISQENVRELLFGSVGAVLAWGTIDGILYALFSVFERGERHRLLEDIQAANTQEEALEIIADDMDYLLEPITGDEERTALYSSILSHLQHSTPRKIGLKREDVTTALAHVLVAIIAIIPSIIPFFIFRYDYSLAIRISILVSFVVLFISGFAWGKYTGVSPWKTGLLIMSIAIILVLIAFLLEG